jgi:proteasome lid subunit RPN8/RPN11
MILPPSIASLQNQLVAHAMEESPREACGLIVDGQYVRCSNIHATPESNFAIGTADYIKAEAQGTIEALFHSHPSKYNKFSVHDAKACRTMNMPWVMYCLGTGDWHYADPTGNAPYEGRQWHYGISDCYSLVRDFYRREFGIMMDDFERGEEYEWEDREWNQFERNFANQGLVAIEQPAQKGDIFLMQLQSPCPNHFGVLAVPSSNIFYHHLLDRLSEANVYGGYWAKHTNKVLRHKELF